eukprot:scaffold1298_cov98-Isochrysis_galbana.AAC.4
MAGCSKTAAAESSCGGASGAVAALLHSGPASLSPAASASPAVSLNAPKVSSMPSVASAGFKPKSSSNAPWTSPPAGTDAAALSSAAALAASALAGVHSPESAAWQRRSTLSPMAHSRSTSRAATTSKSAPPRRAASAALTASPVQKSRRHAAGASRARAATETRPGSAPLRTSGKPKVASALARTSPAAHGKSIPPPRHAPRTAATTGISACWSERSTAPNSTRPSRKEPSAILAADGSPPRQKLSAEAPHRSTTDERSSSTEGPIGRDGSRPSISGTWKLVAGGGAAVEVRASRGGRPGARGSRSSARAPAQAIAGTGASATAASGERVIPRLVRRQSACPTASELSSSSSCGSRQRMANPLSRGRAARPSAMRSARRFASATPTTISCTSPAASASWAHAERADAAAQVAVLKGGARLGHNVVGVQHPRQRAAHQGAVDGCDDGHPQLAQQEEATVHLPQDGRERRQRQLGHRLELVRVAAYGEVPARTREDHRPDVGALRHAALNVADGLEDGAPEAGTEGVEMLGVVQLQVSDAGPPVEPQPDEVVRDGVLGRRAQATHHNARRVD